jgi:hypothetical protein
MKKSLLLLLCLPMIGFGQNCPTIGIPSYYNCSDIAQFVVDYPNCTNLPSTLRLPYDGGDLTNYPGLTQLDSISGSVVCDECEITSFAGLSALKYVGGSVRIDEPHDILTDLYGLTNLSHIGGSLTLLECGDLISTNGIANLNSVNQVRIIECDNLVNIVGFDDIDSLAWGLYIEETSLTNLNGFNNLKFIGNLEISENPMLNNLIGLSSVLTVDGYIEIDDNISLQSLLGLDSIIPNQISNLILKDNDSLSYCNLDNICEYIDQAYGPSTIYANNINCNSILDVQNQCLSLSQNISVELVWHPDTVNYEDILPLEFLFVNSSSTTHYIDSISANIVITPDNIAPSNWQIISSTQNIPQGIFAPGDSIWMFSTYLYGGSQLYQQAGDNLVVIWPSFVTPISSDTSITSLHVLPPVTSFNELNYPVYEKSDNFIYDLMGRRYYNIKNLLKGTMYIRDGKKYIKK